MARPLLSFVGIFKNEAGNIRRTLESVRPYVDRWSILDTGSTDGTQEIIREVMSGVPGVLVEEPFVDFATSRNRVLQIEATQECPASFSLMLSGDEVLVGGEALTSFLAAFVDEPQQRGAYSVTMRSGPRQWPFVRVHRTGGGWVYRGKVHEQLVGPNNETSSLVIPGVEVIHSPSDPERRVKRLREYDLPTLTKVVEDESIPLELRARSIYFLAETHAALAKECGPPVPGGAALTHNMTAMSLFFRFAQLAEDPSHPAYEPHKVAYAVFMFYHIADTTRLYRPRELAERLDALVNSGTEAAKMPEIHFLLAKQFVDIDARLVTPAALRAAKVAREARANPTNIVSDVRIEWMSLHLAHLCAKQMGQVERAKDLAAQAIEAGATAEEIKRCFGG